VSGPWGQQQVGGGGRWADGKATRHSAEWQVSSFLAVGKVNALKRI